MKTGASLLVVGMLVAVTLTTLVAAQGTGQITIRAQYQGPRALDLAPGCDAAAATCPTLLDLMEIQILSAEPGTAYGYIGDGSGYGYTGDGGGYGYTGDGSGYGYGYRFLEWLQNGYGYSAYDESKAIDGNEVVFEFTGLPVGEYLFRIWIDLNQNGIADEDLEPLAFAEEQPDDQVFEITLNTHRTGLAVVLEAGAPLTGAIELADGASPIGANVTAFGPFGDVHKTTADGTGHFSFDALPSGAWYPLSYELLFEKENYYSTSDNVDLGREGAALGSYLLQPMAIGVPFDLGAGWSMISLPVVPQNATVESVFGTHVDVVYAWDGVGYVELSATDTLRPSQGYWAYAPSLAQLTVTGVPQYDLTLDLRTNGWYLTGGPMGSAPLPASPDVEPFLYGWTGTSYTESTTYQQTRGYWLFVVDAPTTIALEGSN